VLVAALAFTAARSSRLFALLHQSRGGMELGALLTLAVFLAVVIFAVRRRQCSAWRSTLQVMGALILGNALAIVTIWPFVPQGFGLALAPMLADTLAAGVMMSLVSLPLAIALLWLSRRYGSHSEVTDRRAAGPRRASLSFPRRTP